MGYYFGMAKERQLSTLKQNITVSAPVRERTMPGNKESLPALVQEVIDSAGVHAGAVHSQLLPRTGQTWQIVRAFP
jgi:hypothetical protein